MRSLIHSLFCGLILLSGAALADEPATAVAPEQQWRVSLLDQTSAEPSAWRLFDERQWQEFWIRNYHQEPPPLPDLPRCSVLVVTGGERPTGGYRLEVVRAVKVSGRWVIEFVVPSRPRGRSSRRRWLIRRRWRCFPGRASSGLRCGMSRRRNRPAASITLLSFPP